MFVEYTVRDRGHAIEFELANDVIFDHEPWELNDYFSADRSKIMFTLTLPGCESEIADSDAVGHTKNRHLFRARKKMCSLMNKMIAKIATLPL